MAYPKAMYKGYYTPSEVVGEYVAAQDSRQEKSLRKQGFVDGHEFFSKPAVEKVKEE